MSVLNPIYVRTALIALAAFGLMTATIASASAQSSIRILVNDEPITSYDIQQRSRMLQVFTGGKQGEREATEQLIEERLMLQEAKRLNIEITAAQVDEEMEKRARATKLSVTQFTQALRQAGIDRETFEEFLLANMAWGQVVRARFRATVDVTEQDVTAALSDREPTAEEATAFEYRLQPILFVLPAGASASAEAQRRNEANAFREAFQGCDQSLQQAAGMTDVVVRPQTRREEGQMSEAQREAFAKIEVGSTTEPERIAEGLQIIAICAKNAIAGQTEAAVEVRQEISSERGQLLARRYLRDLRSDAVIEYR
jgi:peptidyl-prolyl cis-trans isomerase SurA